ncbi:MAG: flagellar basal body-associated FliL family protein, partial [Rhodospirillaceae bacterium]
GGGEAAPEKGGKKKLLIIVALLLLLIVGGLAAAYFTGLMDPVIAMITGKEGEGDAGNEKGGEPGQAIFYDLQEMLVNLNTDGRKSSFLKIRISLELENQADIPRIEREMPRIVDNFQTYLRELLFDDLKGSAGMYRLREELLIRVSAAAAPAKIRDVLFTEMLVQ